jgi:beta-phosphoglucomutase-like phosphatase (HAD superfamily)
MLSAVIFDLDGTLADTERQNAESVARALARAGRTVTEKERAFVVGHGWREIYQHLCERAPLPFTLPELMARAAVERERLVEADGLDVLPGAVEAVRRVAARVPITVVSGSSRGEIAFCLRALAVDGLIPWYVGAEDVPRGKPFPDGYLYAAQRLGVAPARCIAIEDSTAGILAAKAAGMRCVAVRAGNFAQQDQSGADRAVDTLNEVNDRLLDEVAGRPYTVGERGWMPGNRGGG